VRQLFQVALELELPGNVWGVGFPPEDWGNFVLTVGAKSHVAKGEDIVLSLPEKSAENLRDAKPSAEPELPPPAIGTDRSFNSGFASTNPETLHVLPPPTSTTDASLQLARQVARLIADAKQQISAAAREAAAQAVATEHHTATDKWQLKFSAAQSDIATESGRAVERIQHESDERSRAVYSAAAKALQDELPKWLAPHLEQLTREVTATISKAGAEQHALHEQHAAGITERVQQLCREAEEVARRIVAQSQELERRIAEQSSVTSAVMDSRVRKQEEAFGAHQDKRSCKCARRDAGTSGSTGRSGTNADSRVCRIGGGKTETRRGGIGEPERS
jgi:hypothetical protein